MNKRMVAVALFSLLGYGCLSHWIVDSETRLQIENRTGAPLANLLVVSEDPSFQDQLWIPDTVADGGRSRVVSRDLVGTFHMRLSIQDSACGTTFCWRIVDLGYQRIDGGSLVWRITTSGDSLLLEEK